MTGLVRSNSALCDHGLETMRRMTNRIDEILQTRKKPCIHVFERPVRTEATDSVDVESLIRVLIVELKGCYHIPTWTKRHT